MEEEWNQTNLNLQTAREQNGDLNLQVTILTSGKNQNKQTQMFKLFKGPIFYTFLDL